jgi:hypothetical protein
MKYDVENGGECEEDEQKDSNSKASGGIPRRRHMFASAAALLPVGDCWYVVLSKSVFLRWDKNA